MRRLGIVMCQSGLSLCKLLVPVCVTCGSVNKTVHFFIWFVTIMGVRVCTETECGQCARL